MTEGVREIAALARELAERDRGGSRACPRPLLERLRDSGLMNAGAPREAGGLELAPGELLRHAATIAAGDASAGWCVSIAATSSLLAGYLGPRRGVSCSPIRAESPPASSRRAAPRARPTAVSS